MHISWLMNLIHILVWGIIHRNIILFFFCFLEMLAKKVSNSAQYITIIILYRLLFYRIALDNCHAYFLHILSYEVGLLIWWKLLIIMIIPYSPYWKQRLLWIDRYYPLIYIVVLLNRSRCGNFYFFLLSCEGKVYLIFPIIGVIFFAEEPFWGDFKHILADRAFVIN